MNTNWTGDSPRQSVSGGTTLERSEMEATIGSHAGQHAAVLTEWVPLRSHQPIGNEMQWRGGAVPGIHEPRIPWLVLGAFAAGALAAHALSRALTSKH